MTSPEPHAWLDQPLPDLVLPGTQGDFALRSRVGNGPLALFFIVRSGTPG